MLHGSGLPFVNWKGPYPDDLWMSLYVESIGAGPDLVMLHGWAMHSGAWGGAVDRLTRHFRLHLVDLPGHGFSRGFNSGCMSASSASEESPSEALEYLVAMVEEILPDEAIVCGWSLGGQIAIELAVRHPKKARKLALVSTTPCFTRRHDWPYGTEAAMLQLFTANLKRDYRVTMNRFLTLQVRGTNENAGDTLSQLRQNVFMRGEPDEAALEAGLRVLLASDLRKKIPSIEQHVLLLHGENDVISHPDAARWMSRKFPNAELLMLPHCGHAPFLSHPDQFADGMARLL